ncbi:hypothetical protein BC835DRAFT_1385537 [Cytidiella melzeri]|nr:hypothetical protein BC835DRAFT_1385537 [Cytidiella melzeri]
MENRKRKREEDVEDTIITFHAPNGRTFSRVFKEKSLATTKETVRKKLALAPGVQFDLAQLRNGKAVDLEDDDDFSAFCALARTTTSLDVQVTVSKSPSSTTLLQEVDPVESGSGEQQRHINALSISHHPQATAKVAFEPGGQLSASDKAFAPDGEHGELTGDITGVDTEHTSHSVPSRLKKRKTAAPEEDVQPRESAPNSASMEVPPTQEPYPRKKVARGLKTGAAGGIVDTLKDNDDSSRKKKAARSVVADAATPTESQKKVTRTPDALIATGSQLVSEFSIDQTATDLSSKKKKQKKARVSLSPIDLSTSTQVNAKNTSLEGATQTSRSKKAPKSSAVPQDMSRNPSASGDELPPPATTREKAERNAKSTSASPLVDVEVPLLQRSGLKAKNKKPHVLEDTQPESTVISNVSLSISSIAAGILATIEARRAVPSGTQPAAIQSHALTETHPSSPIRKYPPPLLPEPQLQPSPMPPPTSTSRREDLQSEEGKERATLRGEKGKERATLQGDLDKTEATTLPVRVASSPAETTRRAGKQLARCPICLQMPFHLRYKCPVVVSGPESLKRRIDELQGDASETRLLRDMQVLLHKTQEREALSKSRAKAAENGSSSSNSDSDLGNGSLFATRTSSPEIPLLLTTAPALPPGAEISEVVVQSKDDDSSSDSDSLSRDEFDDDNEVVNPAPLYAGLTSGLPASQDSTELNIEALLRGPVSSMNAGRIVDKMFAEAESSSDNEESGVEDVAFEEEEMDEKVRRRLWGRMPSSDEDDESEDSHTSEASNVTPVVMHLTSDPQIPVVLPLDDTADGACTKEVFEMLDKPVILRASVDSDSDANGQANDVDKQSGLVGQSASSGSHLQKVVKEVVPSSDPADPEEEDADCSGSGQVAVLTSGGGPSEKLQSSSAKKITLNLSSPRSENSPDIPLTTVPQQDDDPIEPSDDPDSSVVDDDPIELDVSQVAEKAGSLSPVQISKQGATKNMKDRNGKIRTTQELPIAASSDPKQQSPSTGKFSSDVQTTTVSGVDVAEETNARRKRKAVKIDAPVDDKPADPIPKRRGRPPLTQEQKDARAAERARLASENLSTPAPKVSRVATKGLGAPAPDGSTASAPKKRGRPPLTQQQRDDRAAEKNERVAAEKKAQKGDNARQKPVSVLPKSRKSVGAAETSTASALKPNTESTPAKDISPSALRRVNASGTQKTAAVTSAWETLSATPSAPDMTMVDELQPSSPGETEEQKAEGSSAAKPPISAFAKDASSQPLVDQDASQSFFTPTAKERSVPLIVPLFLPSTQQFLPHEESTPLTQQPARPQHNASNGSPDRLRPLSAWAKSPFPRLSDLASQQMFSPLMSHPVPPRPAAATKKQAKPLEEEDSSSSSSSSDSEDSEEETASHIPKERRAGAQRKK